jgi:hypothetical protein
MAVHRFRKRILDPLRALGGKILRISDEVYITVRFKKVFRREINLLHPCTYNEKIQCLKLYNHDPLMTKLADKYEVRRYVAERGFAHTLNELYGVYERTADINLESLPDQFVMKATHGSGWNILCPDKNSFDWNAARRQLDQWLRMDYSSLGKEWAYKNIRPRIVVERYLGYQINDYKFSCFNGVPRYIGVDIDRLIHHKRNIYDTNWNLLPINMNYDNFDSSRVPKPHSLPELLEVAAGLARGLPFVRVDLYEVEGRVYFGEMTLYPSAGLQRFTPVTIDDEWGRLFDVSAYQPTLNQKLCIRLANLIVKLVK